jgi:hypothetical protein
MSYKPGEACADGGSFPERPVCPEGSRSGLPSKFQPSFSATGCLLLPFFLPLDEKIDYYLITDTNVCFSS